MKIHNLAQTRKSTRKKSNLRDSIEATEVQEAISLGATNRSLVRCRLETQEEELMISL